MSTAVRQEKGKPLVLELDSPVSLMTAESSSTPILSKEGERQQGQLVSSGSIASHPRAADG